MSSREEIVDQVLEVSRRLVRELNPPTSSEWLGLDLTMAQLKTLFALGGSEPKTVSELAQKLQVHLPAASYAIDRLVRLDLAERSEDPEDRRRTYVRLSERGRLQVRKLLEGRSERLRGWLSVMSREDCLALLRGVEALLAVASREPRSGEEPEANQCQLLG